MDVFVGNLPPRLGQADVERLFQGYGEYRSFVVGKRRLSQGRLTHYAVGRILPDEEARRAIRELNMRSLGDRALLVMEYFSNARGQAPGAGLAVVPKAAPPSAPDPGNVICGNRLFRRHRRGEPRKGERRQSQRRDEERRSSERRVAERRQTLAHPGEHPLGEARFNDHRVFQRRVGERRVGVERRSADRRHADRRD